MTYKGELTRRRIKRKKDENFSYFSMGFPWNTCGIDYLKKIKLVVFVSHLSSCLFLLGKIVKKWEDTIIFNADINPQMIL